MQSEYEKTKAFIENLEKDGWSVFQEVTVKPGLPPDDVITFVVNKGLIDIRFGLNMNDFDMETIEFLFTKGVIAGRYEESLATLMGKDWHGYVLHLFLTNKLPGYISVVFVSGAKNGNSIHLHAPMSSLTPSSVMLSPVVEELEFKTINIHGHTYRTALSSSQVLFMLTVTHVCDNCGWRGIESELLYNVPHPFSEDNHPLCPECEQYDVDMVDDNDIEKLPFAIYDFGGW